MSKVNINEVSDILSVLEILPIVLKIGKEIFSVVKACRIPSLLGTFIGYLILLINELSTQHSILIVGDFSFDQMLSENVAEKGSLNQNLNLSQHSQNSTNIHGRILDIVFHTLNSNISFSLSSSYSDHFVPFSNLKDNLYTFISEYGFE